MDDEQHIVEFVGMGLKGRGMEVLAAADGSEALTLFESFVPDVVVLDLMMPDLSGFEVATKIRSRSSVPIIVLSARDEVADKVKSLGLGVDDYLTKPFALDELAARVIALLRRSGGPQGHQLQYAGITLDVATRDVHRNGRSVELTPREFDLLHLLISHPRQVFSKDQILSKVWGYDYVGESNVVEAYISYLRRKLEEPGEPNPVQTIRGVGYRMRG